MLNKYEIDLLKRIKKEADKLLVLLDDPLSEHLPNEIDQESLREGVQQLKRGCEITLAIQEERKSKDKSDEQDWKEQDDAQRYRDIKSTQEGY